MPPRSREGHCFLQKLFEEFPESDDRERHHEYARNEHVITRFFMDIRKEI